VPLTKLRVCCAGLDPAERGVHLKGVDEPWRLFAVVRQTRPSLPGENEVRFRLRETLLKLFYSATSPFVRKVLVAALELGLRERIEFLPAKAHVIDRDRTIIEKNPLGQVPTFITDDGAVLYDSRVIIEYLNALGDGHLIPRGGAARWGVLTEQSLADGILDAALLARYETALRPENLRWDDWTAGQLDKINCGLADLEARAAKFGDRVDLGTISFGCALGYLDFRFPTLGWRDMRPNVKAWFARFGERKSMVATRPPPA
jgi:glutathione S-transferase